MRSCLKFCLTLLAIALQLAFEAVTGQGVETPDASASTSHAYILPGKIGIEWHLVDEHRVWLSINHTDRQAWPKEGYNPSFTNIVATYKPIVHKLKNGQYEITFTSEIAEGLP